ncbi:hypothetical protein [Streptomyces sp. NBC_01006]|uniref:hypothetical protein n=1 Tax=Streptomyces sp. NBC_01006 TaxID=2903716 RepID=UPI003868F130|nr:hypothetical protein OG509_02030 [Streptomyces sp. NBC_01006]
MQRSHRRAGLSVALAFAAVWAAGCTAGSAGGGAGPAVSRPASPPPSDAGSAADPATWELPLMRYAPTPAEERTLARAEEGLVQQCAAGFGVRLPPEPELPPIGGRNLMDWRYGIHDPALTSLRGYQTDAAQQARYDASLREASRTPRSAPDTDVLLMGRDIPPDLLARASPGVRDGVFAGKTIPQGGCVGEARRTLYTSTRGVSPLVRQLSSDSYPKSAETPEVRAVFERWSRCMAEKGFTYAKPMDANDDPRFRPRPDHTVTSLETTTALADLGCRTAGHVAETWHAAEVRVQQESIAGHSGALDADRQALDRSLAVAAQVLAAAGPPQPSAPAAGARG